MEGKNLLLCCDGTGNEYTHVNTNIVKIVELALRDSSQVVFYDPGVGTINPFGGLQRATKSTLIGKAFGVGLLDNVLDGYRFLMHHYQQGDKVFIFGFSRGAFTARFLAGLLSEWGLLYPGTRNLIPYVAKYLKNRADPSLAQGFRKTFCQTCFPHFLGLFDTVRSLGTIYGKQLPPTTLHPNIKNIYHALAIDEKRKHFQPALFDETQVAKEQTLQQVWFSGVHADIGGGYKERGLCDISLQWMLEAASLAGLTLTKNWQHTLSPNPLAPLHLSNTMAWKMAAMLKPQTPSLRVLPKGANIHSSVAYRLKHKSSYHPKNLKDYKVVGEVPKISLKEVPPLLNLPIVKTRGF